MAVSRGSGAKVKWEGGTLGVSSGKLYTEVMSKAEIQRQVMELPGEARIEIAEAIWSSLGDPDAVPLPQWQRDLLNERLASAETEEGRDWEEIKAEIDKIAAELRDVPALSDEAVSRAGIYADHP